MWINCDDGDFLYVDCIRVNILVVTLSIGLQDVTTAGKWVKDTADLSVLFLTIACNSQLSYNKKLNLKVNMNL